MAMDLWRKKLLCEFSLAIITVFVCSYIGVICAAQQQNEARTVRDLSYFEGSNDPAQTLDLYLPAKQKSDKKLPLLVWIHGGGWRAGSKADVPAPTALALNGYAVASLNYRLTDRAKFPAQILDCKTAIRYLRKHADEYGIDADRIGVWGASAGGHLVALLGTTNDSKEFDRVGGNLDVSSRVEAVCDICGPSDLTTIKQQCGPDYRLKDMVRTFLGGDPEEVKDIALDASPVAHVAPGNPPFLIMHGDHDELVPYEQGKELYNALKKAQVDARLFTAKGGTHGFMNGQTVIEAKNFFDQKLKARVPSGS
jgi:acetyl esterase/lipase